MGAWMSNWYFGQFQGLDTDINTYNYSQRSGSLYWKLGDESGPVDLTEMNIEGVEATLGISLVHFFPRYELEPTESILYQVGSSQKLVAMRRVSQANVGSVFTSDSLLTQQTLGLVGLVVRHPRLVTLIPTSTPKTCLMKTRTLKLNPLPDILAQFLPLICIETEHLFSNNSISWFFIRNFS